MLVLSISKQPAGRTMRLDDDTGVPVATTRVAHAAAAFDVLRQWANKYTFDVPAASGTLTAFFDERVAHPQIRLPVVQVIIVDSQLFLTNENYDAVDAILGMTSYQEAIEWLLDRRARYEFDTRGAVHDLQQWRRTHKETPT